MKKINNKGFTLVELLAVIAVISLVLGLSTYGIINSYNNSKNKAYELNEKGIFEAARISSNESDSWRDTGDWYGDGSNVNQYFCTTIQRLQNAGILKKGNVSLENRNITSIITVRRNKATKVIDEIRFLDLDDKDDKTLNDNICNIKFFKVVYEDGVDTADIEVPDDQTCEVGLNNCIVSKAKIDYYNYNKFKNWMEMDSEGNVYVYQPGSTIPSDRAPDTTVTLTAQWKKDEYTIEFYKNDESETYTDQTCTHNKSCTLKKNSFTRNGYDFIGWKDATGNSYDDEEERPNFTKNDSIKLYAQWKASSKVIINFYVDEKGVVSGATIKKKTPDTNVKYYWKKDTNNLISRSTDNKNYRSDFFEIPINESKKLKKYNDTNYMNISKSEYSASSSSTWKCLGSTQENGCKSNTYSVMQEYSYYDFCWNTETECKVDLAVNWAEILSPIFIPTINKVERSDISSNVWFKKAYCLTITSENTDSVSYKYKENGGNYEDYSRELCPPEGTTSYTAKTVQNENGSESGEVSYIAKIDTVAPVIESIDNPTNGNWTNTSFPLTIHASDAGSGIKKYQYHYESTTDWKNFSDSNNSNSDINNFKTNNFSKERNELVYIRACDNVDNCSEPSSTYIRIDKTKPELEFSIKNGNTNLSYATSASTSVSWINKVPTLTYKVTDLGSGISNNGTISWNRPGNYSNYDVTILGGETCPTNSCTVTQITKGYKFVRAINSDGLRYVTFTITDIAGNSKTHKVYFKLDKTAPDAPTINNPFGENWANANDIANERYKLTLNSSETGSGIKNFQYSRNKTTWTNFSGNWNSNNYITNKIQDNQNNDLYVRACDYAGNCSDYSTTPIKIDTIAPAKPTITNPFGGKWANANDIAHERYKLTLNSSDSGSGIEKFQYSRNATSWTNFSGNWNSNNYITNKIQDNQNNDLYVRACDKAGNCSNYNKTRIKIDTIAPTRPTITNPSGGNWTNSSFDVTLSTTESGSGSGVAYFKYYYGDTAPTSDSGWSTHTNSNSTQVTKTWSAERNAKLTEVACDNAGNCSDSSSTYIRIDKTAPTNPTITNPFGGKWANANDIANERYKLTLNSNDQGSTASGINKFQYSYNATSWTNFNGNWNSNNYITNKIQNNQNNDLYVRACDNAGNCSNYNKTRIKIDTIAPTSPTINNPFEGKWANKSDIDNERYKLTLSSNDQGSTASGINKFQYSYNATSWTNFGGNWESNKFITNKIYSNQDKNLHVRVCDNAGNCSNYNTTHIKIDTAAPTSPTITNPFGENWANANDIANERYKLTLSSNDPGSTASGINKFQYSYNATSWTNFGGNWESNKFITNKIYSNQDKYLHVRVCDNAGNCSGYNTTHLKIDTIAPTRPTINNPSNGNWTNSDIYVTLSTTEKGSGVAYFKYYYGDTAPASDSGWSTHSNSNSTQVAKTWTAERNSRLTEVACDNAGNCSDSSSTYIRIDKTAPNIQGVILNGNNVASGYYSSEYDSSLPWFYNFQPVIRWTATDSASGINSNATYKANKTGGQALDDEHQNYLDTEKSVTATNSGSNYYFTVGNGSGISGGYRKFKIKVCDIAGNCTENPIYFKYYGNNAQNFYVNVNTSLLCRDSLSVSANTITSFTCGTILNVIKTYSSKNWYYYPSRNCYVRGAYLSGYKPNCSSGSSGGGSGAGGTTVNDGCTCNTASDCNMDFEDTLSITCRDHKCQYHFNNNGHDGYFSCIGFNGE